MNIPADDPNRPLFLFPAAQVSFANPAAGPESSEGNTMKGNSCDNCPMISNADQTDEDNDNIGNVCDNFCCDPSDGAGDADDNGATNILDITYLISFLYKEGLEPSCFHQGDANGNEAINILDITFLITYLYKDGPAPVCL